MVFAVNSIGVSWTVLTGAHTHGLEHELSGNWRRTCPILAISFLALARLARWQNSRNMIIKKGLWSFKYRSEKNVKFLTKCVHENYKGQSSKQRLSSSKFSKKILFLSLNFDFKFQVFLSRKSRRKNLLFLFWEKFWLDNFVLTFSIFQNTIAGKSSLNLNQVKIGQILKRHLPNLIKIYF